MHRNAVHDYQANTVCQTVRAVLSNGKCVKNVKIWGTICTAVPPLQILWGEGADASSPVKARGLRLGVHK